MGFIRFALWTSLAVGLGIFLAGYPIVGKTPLQHAGISWKQVASPKVGTLKEGLSDALDQAKDSLSSERKIRERHSVEDREEVARLIQKRSTGK